LIEIEPAAVPTRRPLSCATERSIVPPSTDASTMPLPVFDAAPGVPGFSYART
jgi:hypothetical protein